MYADRRAKIVATIGPATRDKEALERCLESGMNVARLNFSHGTHAEHAKVIRDLRELSKKHQSPVTILQDLQGPKIRVGAFENGQIEVRTGETLIVRVGDQLGGPGLIYTDFSALPQTVKEGDRILLDDGLLEFRVLSAGKDEVSVEVVEGGVLKDRKGFNIPGVPLPIDPLTEKDLRDLEFGLEQDVDFVALSFVRQAKDIRKLRELIEAKGKETRIIAKIEMLEALENLDEIVRASDAVMVARGDLAIEIGQTLLPGVQKRIISLCNRLGRPVITATQMLDSMVENPRPTRAEITDVANAVLDGSDALMLSAESASGRFPFRCIRTMHEIIVEVEKNESEYYQISTEDEFSSIADAIGASASLSALKLKASAIVCLTTTGKTANIIASYRPRARIISASPVVDSLAKLELTWGVQTLPIAPYASAAEAMAQIEEKLIEFGLAKAGEKVVLTLGLPVKDNAKTNSLRVYTLGSSVNPLPGSQRPLRCREDSDLSLRKA